MTVKVVIPVLLCLISCQNTEIPSVENNTRLEPTLNDTFNLPLDTTKIIQLLDIKTKDQIADFNIYSNSLDTIELSSANFACDCQDWVKEEYWESKNLGKFGYFISPFNDEILLSESISVFRNRIRLFGTSHFENDRHLNTKLSDTIRVFTYYAYEVLLPAKVYGPQYHTGKTELPSSTEEYIGRSVIKLKKK